MALRPTGRECSGGSADSGFTAAVGAPTPCGTGPVGSKGHTADEWLPDELAFPTVDRAGAALVADIAGRESGS